MKQKIVKYKIGWELDHLIAEKILGWKKIEVSPPYRGLAWMWDRKEGALVEQAQMVPQYSRDLNQAFAVLKHFDYVDLRKHDYDCNPVKWTCYLKAPKTPGFTGTEASADEPAHAVCLAALRSIGVIIEEEVADESNGQVV